MGEGDASQSLPCSQPRNNLMRAQVILLEQLHYLVMYQNHRVIIHLRIGVVFEWLVSETPYLIYKTSKTPHITGCRIFLVMNCLCVESILCVIIIIQEIIFIPQGQSISQEFSLLGMCSMCSLPDHVPYQSLQSGSTKHFYTRDSRLD